ncbi:MAG: hypothetical protein ACKOB2_03045, partial [Solirubrobacterales bacterium]
GEARPWPKGGPLFGGGGDRKGDDSGDGVIEGEAEEVSAGPEELPQETGEAEAGEAPRKRKKRDA